MKIRSLIALFLLLGIGAFLEVSAQRRKAPPKPVAPRSAYLPPKTDGLSPDKKARVEAFDKVWRTIFYYYFDGRFNNVNWEAVKLEFEPKVRAARTDSELHDLLDSMLERLKSSHLGIIRPAVFEALEAAKETAREKARERELLSASGEDTIENDPPPNFDDPLSIYGPGIELRLIDDRFVVFRVGENSAAEYRGIKPGFVIETIDDVSMQQLFARVRILARNEPSVLRQIPMEIVNEMLNGEKDSTVKVGYLDLEDKKGEIVLRRERLRTVTASMGTDHPEMQLTFVARPLGEDTAYIHFDNFSLPVIDKFCTALSQLGSRRSLIIDLRGNTGGIIGVSVALAGMLSDKPVDLGTSIYRYGPEPLIAQPKAKQFKGAIVILTDELSISAAEMFAASMQAAKRATVIGAQSAGESLPSVTVELQTGARLMYPVANYRTVDGKYLEGKGVTPDIVVPLDRQSLIKGRDPQLAAAIAELSKPPAEKPRTAGEKTESAERGSALLSGPVPPPPPMKAPPRSLGTVTVKAPPPPAEPPNVIEPKAVELMKEFERLAGGLKAYSAITDYKLTGTVVTVTMASRQEQDYFSYRQGNTRHLNMVKSAAIGETRSFRDGKIMRLTSDLGVEIQRPFLASIAETDFLYSITRSMQPGDYKHLAYLGVFDRGDRKVHLIDGKTKDGVTIAIYFDTETKLLSGFEGPTGGLSFGDYRKVGDVMFPFNISSQEFLNIQLSDVQLNPEIDPAVFEKKVNCFDKP
ncbi:MAG: hypothetical protein IPM25_02910 [Chloracidobacterium sp.]|nr:hypothetical protein [Chloracidobacterium sp.]